MKLNLKPLVFCTLIIGALAAFVADYYDHRGRNAGPSEWKKISPFTDLKFEGDDKILAEYEGTFYELSSIAGITSEGLIEASRDEYGSRWKKRIREDIADVLTAAGAPESTVVSLELKDVGTGETLSIPEAEMTAENRAVLYARES